ncbi:MAG TPA: TAXI family TRAP transporter solute-binding subunit [Sumerlaeia bacterium]|nr:TAXI family TRAP transporter solute-binding subunit [Sumerlaeia bacterium]
MRPSPAFLVVPLFLLVLGLCRCGERGEDAETGDARTPTAPKRLRFATIGTGGMTGVYYPTGGALAKMVNRKVAEYGLRCTAESTGGSVFNINAVLTGDLEFGIAQSDRQYQAVKGLAEWEEKGPQAGLRAAFSIHPESVTLVAADDAGIETILDLRGKRVNIGSHGSGQRQNAIDALANAGIDFEKDVRAESVKAAEAPGLLQDDRIDAFFYTVGHPSGAIKEATAGRRKVHFVPLIALGELFERYPYYVPATIAIGNYPQATNKTDAPTFGVKATLVTSAQTPDDMVYVITREVFENLGEFKKLHPAYAGLTREKMLEGLTAPIHPGAMQYYKEAGLK